MAYNPERLESFTLSKIPKTDAENASVRLLKRSIDARSKKPKVNVTVEIYINEPLPNPISYKKDYPNVANATPVVIVGAGPAGMFAALRLVELGMKPILLDRGKDVRARRRDLAAINKDQIVNPESNYCFGEGGAGTYSDGKLYTRSKKRGSWTRILEIFVAHGASEDILVEAHPHIGTNKLPKIVSEIRESILNAGGEVHFDTKVTDFILQNKEMKGVITERGEKIEAVAVLLATGHSARDIFELLDEKGIEIEAKPFALGVRVEHAQKLIDKIQYNMEDRGEFLPASSYSLVSQVNFEGKEKGVFSFCMCPGGFIVPSATAKGEVVVNGMSPSRRNSKFSNSGIVVSVDESDWEKDFGQFGNLAGLRFQEAIERKACEIAGNTQVAPAQRLVDFVSGKTSKSLLETSYQPGLASVEMRQVLPKQISYRLKHGFKSFGNKNERLLYQRSTNCWR